VGNCTQEATVGIFDQQRDRKKIRKDDGESTSKDGKSNQTSKLPGKAKVIQQN